MVYTGAREFVIKGDYLFIVEEDKDKPEPEHKRFFLTKTGERFVEAKLNSLPSWIHSIFTSVRYNSLVNAKLNLFLRNVITLCIEGQQRRTDLVESA